MQSGGVKCSNGKENCKSFKIMGSGIGFKGGSYKAQTIGVAAHRAGKQLFKKIDKDDDLKNFSSKGSIKFILRETTRGSEKKTKAYMTTRKLLDTPKVIKRSGLEILCKYEYNTSLLSPEDSDILTIQQQP